MSDLAGLPDFGTPLSGDGLLAFATYGGGDWLVTPSLGQLTAFRLAMTRTQGDSSDGYAMLDLDLGCAYALDAALAAARAVAPGATASPLRIGEGWARLTDSGAQFTLPAALTQPISLGWSAADGASWSVRLDIDSGEVIKGLVATGALPFGARVDFAISGVAARANATASFVPAQLIPQLRATAADFVSREALITTLSDPAKTSALESAAARTDIAEALADRILAEFGTFVPATGALDNPAFTLADSTLTERLDWDLGAPAPGLRGFFLGLPSFGALSGLDPASLVVETTIPPLDLGFRAVTIAANLPASRIGVPVIGARLSAPPAPPERPSGFNQSLTFTPPEDEAQVSLRYAPGETLAYTLTPFTVLTPVGLPQELDARPIADAATFQQLQARDFQLAFCHISASARLLAAGAVTGVFSYAQNGVAATQTFGLSATKPDAAVAMPLGAEAPSLKVTVAAAGGAALSLTPGFASRLSLDFPSFPQYGPQSVAVHGAFQGGEAPVTLEFQPENGTGGASLAFAPSAPDARWGYFALSPFQNRYRWRFAGGAWSAYLDPGQPLTFTPPGPPVATGLSTLSTS
jgi:hypothetical protein